MTAEDLAAVLNFEIHYILQKHQESYAGRMDQNYHLCYCVQFGKGCE